MCAVFLGFCSVNGLKIWDKDSFAPLVPSMRFSNSIGTRNIPLFTAEILSSCSFRHARTTDVVVVVAKGRTGLVRGVKRFNGYIFYYLI